MTTDTLLTLKLPEGYCFADLKLRRYAAWQSRDYDRRTGAITLYHWWLKPGFRFFKHFVLRGGLLDGWVGYKVSAYAAWAVRLRYEALRDLRAGRPWEA